MTDKIGKRATQIAAAAALFACLTQSAAVAQYNPATQGKTSLYADPRFQGTGQVIFYRGTGLCLSVQNAVFRDWTPILLEPCDGSPRQQFTMEGDLIRLAPNKQLCLDRQRIQTGTENGELNLENCSEKRTKWRFDAGAGKIRGTSHIDYTICVYPQGGRAASGVRMMAGPPGCGGQALGYGPLQSALAGGAPQQNPQPPRGGPPPNPQGGYQIYWRQVGGPWATGPYPSQTPTCLHGHPNAACNGQNFKGTYKPGQTTTFWLNGCQAPPLTIKCEVRDATGRILASPTPQTASSFGDRGGAGCPPPGRYKSPPSQQSTTAVFTNRADRAVSLYWLDFDGKAKEYAGLLPGESSTQRTFVGHVWIAKSFDGACFGGLHMMNPGLNRIDLR